MEKGQEIAYNTSRNYFSKTFIRFDKVAKITKTGIVTLENGRRFNKVGDELKSDTNQWPSAYLVDVNQAKEQIARDDRNALINEKKNRLGSMLRCKREITTDQLNKIDALIEALAE